MEFFKKAISSLVGLLPDEFNLKKTIGKVTESLPNLIQRYIENKLVFPFICRSVLIVLIALIPIVFFSLLAGQYGEIFLADPSLLTPLMFAGEYIVAIALLTFFVAVTFAAIVEVFRKNQLNFYLTENTYVLLEAKLLESAEYGGIF